MRKCPSEPVSRGTDVKERKQYGRKNCPDWYYRGETGCCG